jgi:hypothetical protein
VEIIRKCSQDSFQGFKYFLFFFNFIVFLFLCYELLKNFFNKLTNKG